MHNQFTDLGREGIVAIFYKRPITKQHGHVRINI